MKRFIDIILAAFALGTLFPLFLLIAALNILMLGRPALFSAIRTGYRNKPFRLYKFRSMLNTVGPDGRLLSDDDRVTRWGRFLRASSLDELPQLWNVLNGDMSIVGPRPLPAFYLSRYSARQSKRHLVRPGITGWAQINGRNSVTWDQKFELDVWYVEHQSLHLDLRIMWLTALSLISPRGISPQGQLTMPEFMGTSESTTTPVE